MEFKFTDEHNLLRDMIKKFVDKEVRPLAKSIDEKEEVPREMLNKAAELGFLGMCYPEEYGGVGAGEMGYCILLEEFARACASTTVVLAAHQSIGCYGIYLDGSEEQKKEFLLPAAQGKKIAAFALTEPGSGSDAASIQTTAVLDGDEYVINGQKQWITNGSIADFITLFAVTDKALGAHGGITVFIVDTKSPGFKVGKNDKKMGIKGSHSTTLHFENLRVPKKNVLGQVGFGFRTAMKVLDHGRLGLGAACVGAGKELLELSIKFAKERIQFNEPIANKQSVQNMLAEMATEVYTMESMVYRTAWMADQKMKYSTQSAMVKLYCSEALCRIADHAVQVHGGMGYISEYPIERYYRDARINRIFEGTSEIQKLIIAADVLKKGGMPQ